MPKQSFKIIGEDLSDRCLLRKIAESLMPDDPDDIPSADAIGLETASDCFDYSTNLPGVYQIEHNKLSLIGDNRKYFRTYWKSGDVIEPVFEKDFNNKDDCGCFYLPIKHIQNIKHPFNRGPKTNEEVAEAVVIHTPTNSNFWHFSIRWKDENGDEISVTNSKWKDKLIATIRATVLNLIDRQPCTLKEVPDHFYIIEE